jgi:hypothetical protein
MTTQTSPADARRDALALILAGFDGDGEGSRTILDNADLEAVARTLAAMATTLLLRTGGEQHLRRWISTAQRQLTTDVPAAAGGGAAQEGTT